jgi:hypothetical protein
MLACYRTIELNPHRAGMASHPRQVRWSSYRINAEGKASHLIEPHEQYTRLGRGLEARREAHRALFREALDEAVVNEIRAATMVDSFSARRAFSSGSLPCSDAASPRAMLDGYRAKALSAPALGRTVCKRGPGSMATVDAKTADVTEASLFHTRHTGGKSCAIVGVPDFPARSFLATPVSPGH